MRISSLSWHKTYYDIISAKVVDQNLEYIFLKKDEFINFILKRMKENNFIG